MLHITSEYMQIERISSLKLMRLCFKIIGKTAMPGREELEPRSWSGRKRGARELIWEGRGARELIWEERGARELMAGRGQK